MFYPYLAYSQVWSGGRHLRKKRAPSRYTFKEHTIVETILIYVITLFFLKTTFNSNIIKKKQKSYTFNCMVICGYLRGFALDERRPRLAHNGAVLWCIFKDKGMLFSGHCHSYFSHVGVKHGEVSEA